MIDLSRRFFCFGAAATLIVPPPKKFFVLSPPKIIVPMPERPFDLPRQQMLDLLQKLNDQVIEVSAIPRWVVCSKEWYDQVTRTGIPS